MNDIIKLLLSNILLVLLLIYDKKLSIIIILLMIIYLITMYSNMRNNVVEGFDLYFRDIFYMPEFTDKNEYGAVLPNSLEYNSDYSGYSTMYSFYKGMGNRGMIRSDDQTLYDKTNNLLNELIDTLDDKTARCNGEFTYGKCSKECGEGIQKVTYNIKDAFADSGCEYEDGYTYNQSCYLRECNDSEKCKKDSDCRNGYCKNNICSNVFGCDKDIFIDNCKDKKECLALNKKYKKGQYKYKWDGTSCNQVDRAKYTGEYDDTISTEDITSNLVINDESSSNTSVTENNVS